MMGAVRAAAALLPVAAVALAEACSSSSGACQVGSDCASGVCDSTGQCVFVEDGGPDGGKVDGAAPQHDSGHAGTDASSSGASSSSAIDASVPHDSALPDATLPDASVPDTSTPADAGGDAGQDTAVPDSGICTPNNDGVIDRAEYPMMAGLHADYEFADNVTIDTAGTSNPDGSRTWDLTGPYSGDHTSLVTTDSPTGQWFSNDYSGATYTTPLSDSSTLLGVFQATGTDLQLIGVVSPTKSTTDTELAYQPAAQMAVVPMQYKSTWSSTSIVTGTADGVPDMIYSESYASTVDAYGTMKVPYGTFPVLRIQTTLTRTVGVLVTVTQSFMWVAECFGPVATAASKSDATTIEFTDASEVMRLTP